MPLSTWMDNHSKACKENRILSNSQATNLEKEMGYADAKYRELLYDPTVVSIYHCIFKETQKLLQ